MEKKIFIALICLTTMLIYGCNFKNKIAVQDKYSSPIAQGMEELALIYTPSATTIHPQVFARKNETKNIDLYVIINDSELTFSKTTTNPTAKIRIFYKIMESYENTALVDSAVKILTFQKSETPKIYAIKIAVKPVDLEKFVIQSTIRDINRGKMSLQFTEIDKKDSLGKDNFLIIKTENNRPSSEDYLKPDESVSVNYLCSDYQMLYSSFFEADNSIPILPYNSDPTFKDSTVFEITARNFKPTTLITKKEGLYCFRVDTLSETGLVIPCFNEDYPNIYSLNEMVKPLAYLTSKEEYENIKNAEHKKLAIDDFWYSCTKDVRKAKELIRVYYTRSIFANMYFYDYREGMMTDRGMIYIVLGPPKILALTSKTEVWIYKDKHTGEKVRFVFNKEKSPFCATKYVLRRSTEFKPYWDNAVASWRKGNIFSW